MSGRFSEQTLARVEAALERGSWLTTRQVATRADVIQSSARVALGLLRDQDRAKMLGADRWRCWMRRD